MNQVWLYPEVAGGALIVAIDDFSVEEKCSSNIVLDRTNIFYSGNWASSDYIDVGSNSGTVQFFQSENTLLKAGKRIILGNGTRIGEPSSNGTSFVARIEPCAVENSVCASPFAQGIVSPPISNDVMPTSRESFDANDFNISPNPSSGIFNILGGNSFSNAEKEIEIYNILGAKVHSGKFVGSEYQIDISNKPSGNYLIRIKIAEKVLMYKVLKQ